jgi:hypothetical protein
MALTKKSYKKSRRIKRIKKSKKSKRRRSKKKDSLSIVWNGWIPRIKIKKSDVDLRKAIKRILGYPLNTLGNWYYTSKFYNSK